MAVNVSGGALEFNAVINAAQFNAAISSIEKQLAGLTGTAQKEANAIDSLVRKAASGIAAYATFIGASNFVGDIVRVRGEFQQLEVAFTTMLQSKEKADKLMSEITQFAATTPFELQDVAGATKQLLAFGISADDIIPTLRSLGDVSAGLGQPIGEISYLFGTIKTQGVAMTQDIRQFASRGIPIYEELAKVLQVSTEQVSEFITAGKVGFPEIEQVFKNLTGEGSKFGGLMEAQSKTLTGQISNLRDAWNQMLNDIGKGQEGLFSEIISGATSLVKNFQTVIDILGVLVITYGSYKAALILTNVAASTLSASTKSLTTLQILQAGATGLANRAMALLNKTLLANPIVAVTTGLAALVAGLAIFTKRTTEASRTQKLLNDVMEEANKTVVEETTKLNALLVVAKDETASKQAREQAVRKLNQLAPEYLGNLTLENLKTAEGTRLINEYIEAIKRKAQSQAISNKLVELETKKLEVLNQQASAQNSKGRFNKLIIGATNDALTEIDRQIDLLAKKQQENDVKQLTSETDKQKVKGRTIAQIDEEIKATKELQSANATSSKQYQDYQRKINALEAERKKITGASRAEVNAANKAAVKEENDINRLLEDRKSILEQIADLTKQSQNLNRSKEQQELDRINEKYDAVIKNITEYNKKVNEYNAKQGKNATRASTIGQLEIQKLNDARSRELDNSRLKQQAEAYKANLEKQAELFRRFEEAKKQVGIDKAKELFAEQTGQYENYLELLKEQLTTILPKITLGIANVGEVEKFKAIIDQINIYNKAKNEEQIEDEKQKFTELLEASATYSQQKAAINKKYDELEATLRKNASVGEFDQRKQILAQSRQDELDALESQLLRSSDLYRKLNQDILSFTRERLKEEVKLLKEKLKADSTLTPQQRSDIQSTIDQYQSLLDESNKVADNFLKTGQVLGTVGGLFDELSSSLDGVNDDLAQMFRLLGDISKIGSSAANAVASFASGNILGGISNTISAIAGLFSLGKRAKEERRKQQQEITEFYTRIFTGEQEINRLYRERALEQVRLNKLRIQGLEDERKLLEQQKLQVKQNYDNVFAELQKLTAKVRKQIGFGVSIFSEESLFGKSFQQIEELYLKGQLEGKAKELFELLQKLKQEGADIDAALEAAKEEAQQLFTGTTADSISDAIINGLLDGKRGIADFAGTFEDLMRQAMIQSLKFKYLEGPIKEFFEQFAAASESDGQLTSSEITALQSAYNTIIGNAEQQFQQLQQIAGLNFNSGSNQSNSLTGAIKGITETQAELLAGQFGGLRLTAIDILAVSRQQLNALNMIQANTGANAQRMAALLAKFDAYETGQRELKVRF